MKICCKDKSDFLYSVRERCFPCYLLMNKYH